MDAAVMVRGVSSLDALAPYEHAYRNLLTRLSNGRGLFYQRHWLEALAPVYLAGRRTMLFLLAFRGEALVGVAPLCIERKSLSRFALRRLTFWGGDGGSLMLEGNLLIPDANDAAECMAAWEAHLLAAHRRRFDVIDLGFCREDLVGWRALQSSGLNAHRSSEILKTHVIDLPASFQEYCETKSRSGLSQLRRQERVLAQSHAVEWCIRTTLEGDEFDQIAALHTRRQRELARDRAVDRHSFFEDATSRASMARVLDVAGEAGEARHYLLKIDGRIAAFNLNFVFGRTQFFHSTAIDSSFAAASPGKLVMLRQIQHECERGEVSEIDMMAGTTPLKTSVSTRSLSFGHFMAVHPRSWGAALRYGAYRQLRRLKGQ